MKATDATPRPGRLPRRQQSSHKSARTARLGRTDSTPATSLLAAWQWKLTAPDGGNPNPRLDEALRRYPFAHVRLAADISAITRPQLHRIPVVPARVMASAKQAAPLRCHRISVPGLTITRNRYLSTSRQNPTSMTRVASPGSLQFHLPPMCSANLGVTNKFSTTNCTREYSTSTANHPITERTLKPVLTTTPAAGCSRRPHVRSPRR